MRNPGATLCILALALLLRAALPISAALVTRDRFVYHTLDTASYIRPAVELASTGRFAVNGAPEILRTPGYPLLLIPGVWFGNIEPVTIILQVLLSSLTVFLIFKAAMLVFERTDVALAGAFFYAIEPTSVLFASKIMSETLFTTLIAIFMYCLVAHLRAPSIWRLIGFTLALASAIYVRPIAYLLPAATVVLLVVRALRDADRKLLHQTAMFVLSIMILVGLWHVRNTIAAGYMGFSTVNADNLYFYHGAAVLAAREGVPYYVMQDRLGFRDIEIYFRNHPEQRQWPAARRSGYMQREGLRIVRAHLPVYWKMYVKGVLFTLLEPGAVEYLKLFKLYPRSGGLLGVIVDRGLVGTAAGLAQDQPLVFWSTVALGLFLGAVLLLAAVALLFGRAARSQAIAVMLATTGYLLALSGGPIGQSRFRHPIMPVLCLFAGYGICLVADQVRTRKRDRLP